VNTLARIDDARRMLADARTFDDITAIVDWAEAARAYAKAADLGLEAQNNAAEVKLWAQRRAGEVLADMPMLKAGRPADGNGSTLEPLGITKQDSHRWQQIAGIAGDKFTAFVQATKDAGEELTTAAAVRVAKGKPPIAHHTGESEWYTPASYVGAARAVMGGIDLDPASCAIANEVVGATTFYAMQDDGLEQPWAGRIWMNPPYSTPLIGRFCAKLVDEYQAGAVTEAITLTNNATDTAWFHGLAPVASAVCFTKGRVKFWHPDREATPLQGQALLYLGDGVDEFQRAFRPFGAVWRAHE